MGDDRQSRESIHVGAVPEVVIVMKVRVEHKADRFVRPLANLSNVFPGSRWQKTGIHHENLPFPDDDGSIAAATGAVLNFINAVTQFRYFSFRLSGHWQRCG